MIVREFAVMNMWGSDGIKQRKPQWVQMHRDYTW